MARRSLAECSMSRRSQSKPEPATTSVEIELARLHQRPIWRWPSFNPALKRFVRMSIAVLHRMPQRTRLGRLLLKVHVASRNGRVRFSVPGRSLVSPHLPRRSSPSACLQPGWHPPSRKRQRGTAAHRGGDDRNLRHAGLSFVSPGAWYLGEKTTAAGNLRARGPRLGRMASLFGRTEALGAVTDNALSTRDLVQSAVSGRAAQGAGSFFTPESPPEPGRTPIRV